MRKNKFIGKWRISEMEQWDQDFVDAEVPGYISFTRNGMGEFQFVRDICSSTEEMTLNSELLDNKNMTKASGG